MQKKKRDIKKERKKAKTESLVRMNAYSRKGCIRKKLYTNACDKKRKKEQTTNACGKERKTKPQNVGGK